MKSKFLIPSLFCSGIIAALSLLSPSASADALKEVALDGITITIDSPGSRVDPYTITVQPKRAVPESDISVFALENPSRLVIDVVGVPSRAARRFDLGDKNLTALRVGVHADKTRAVLDLGSSIPPTYTTNYAATGDLTVSLRFGAESAPQEEAPPPNAKILPVEPPPPPPVEKELIVPVPPPPPPVVEAPPSEPVVSEPPPPPAPPVETSEPEKKEVVPPPAKKKEKEPPPPAVAVPEPKPTPQEKPTEEKVSEIPVTAAPAEVEEVEEEEQKEEPKERPGRKNVRGRDGSGSQTLNSLAFKLTDKPGRYAVLINVERLGDYKLTHPKPELYEVLLPGTHLVGSHLTLPQFPPDNFQGFQAIAAVQRGADTIVRIFVDSGVKLSPYRAEGQLWVQIAN